MKCAQVRVAPFGYLRTLPVLLSVGLIALSLLIAPQVGAAPLVYTEVPMGDLVGGSAGTLGVGTNTVSGFSRATGEEDGGDFDFFEFDLDSFNVTLPAGMLIGGISYSVTGFFGDEENTRFDFPGTGHTLKEGATNKSALTVFDLDSGTTPQSFGGLTLPLSGPQTYTFFDNGPFASDCDDECGMNWGYTWTITVRESGTGAVPEPATLALLGLGLAGLGFSRRRKH